MKYMFAMGVAQVLTKYQVNKLQTWAAWPVFQIKKQKVSDYPVSQVIPCYGTNEFSTPIGAYYFYKQLLSVPVL